MADSPDLPPLPSDPAPPERAVGLGASGAVEASSQSLARGAQAQEGGWLHGLWTLLMRLLLLGAGVSVGWLIGMAIAQVFPARSPEPPIAEVALRQSSQTARKLRQLPRWWRGSDAIDLGAGESAPVPESPAATSPTVASPATDLSPEERDRIQADLTLLQQDLAGISTRLQTLESTLGSTAPGTLEERLQRLDQRLDAAASPAPTPSTPAPDAPSNTVALVPYQEPRFPLVSDRILLPSALLFEPGSSILTGPGQQLLDSIASDLRRYGPVTLLVGSHTDPIVATDTASQLTLQQALAVQQHLAPQLDGPRWVNLGYGYSRPRTTGTTAADQQRNQRVEIGVVPGP